MKAASGFFVIFALCHLSFANENGKKCRAEATTLFCTFNTILDSTLTVRNWNFDISCIQSQDDTSVQKVVLCTDPIIKKYLEIIKQYNVASSQAVKKQIIDAVSSYVKNLEAAGIETQEIPMINVLAEFEKL